MNTTLFPNNCYLTWQWTSGEGSKSQWNLVIHYSLSLVLLLHLSCLNQCPSNNTNVFAAQYHAPHTAELNKKRAVSPHRSLQGGVQINGSIVNQLLQHCRFPAVTNRRWTQNHSWAQDTFRSPTQCVVKSIPAVSLSAKWTRGQIIPDTSLSQLAMQISHRGIQNVNS